MGDQYRSREAGRLAADLVGIALMPVLLWAGMRLAGERNNYLLVACCGVLWPFIGGMLIEEEHGVTATVLLLAVFPVLGGALSPLGPTGAYHRTVLPLAVTYA